MTNKQSTKQFEKSLGKVYRYTESQMDKVMNFIEKKFGNGGKRPKEGLLSHEIKSEYIHTDVVITGNDDYTHFVSCGMGAREMNGCIVMGLEPLSRIELYFAISPDSNLSDEDKKFLCAELTRITKYPFRENTFFGPGHTINTSKGFKEKYGYEYFLFFVPTEKVKLKGCGDVHFLLLIPIYEEERNWMVENNSFEWLYAMEDLDEAVFIDKKREVFIPNEEK